MKKNKMIYLAVPYSSHTFGIEEFRFREVTKLSAKLFSMGIWNFSPITHSHPMKSFGAPTTFKAWEAFDDHMMSICDEVWVYMMHGWKESIGVTAEIKFADDNNIPIRYIPYHTVGSESDLNKYIEALK